MRVGLALYLVTTLLGAPTAFGQRVGGPSIGERLDALRETPLPHGLHVSIRHHLETAERITRRHPEAAAAWRRSAAEMVAAAEEGRDPLLERRGLISNRG